MMGNINCLPRRRKLSNYFRSRVKICRNPERSRSDGSLGSLGNCAFEDEIVDPVEASLITNGIEDISLETRDVIDVMVAFRRVPWVKAIARIQADDASFKWRKDPIPEVERRGSINDLTERREMRKREKMEEEATRAARSHIRKETIGEALLMKSLKKPMMIDLELTQCSSKCYRQFSKVIDAVIEEGGEEEEEIPLTPRPKQPTYIFVKPYDADVMETGTGDGTGLRRRHISHNGLPPVD